MEYIIGRDANTSQLNIIYGQQIIKYGLPGSVPMTVSRQHCSLEMTDNGQMMIKNLKVQNFTYVNDVAIESKVIKPSDRISLGTEHYQLNLAGILKAIDSSKPKEVDIHSLKTIWENYNNTQLNMRIKQGKFVALSSGTGLITMAAVVLSFMGVGMEVRIACYILAAILIMVTIAVRWQNATKIPLEQEKMKKWLRDNYTCPNCRHSFTMDYDTLSQYDACPYCKAKFKK